MTDFCNLSASRLTRIFREQTGMTSKNYIDSLKMQLASEMLAVKNKTVKEITGDTDPYHFSRRFKELTGFSPQKYKDRFLRQGPPACITPVLNASRSLPACLPRLLQFSANMPVLPPGSDPQCGGESLCTRALIF